MSGPRVGRGRPARSRAVALAGALGGARRRSRPAPRRRPRPQRDRQRPSTTSCPTYNPPDELTLAGGTPQTAKLDSAVRRAAPGHAREHQRLPGHDRRRRHRRSPSPRPRQRPERHVLRERRLERVTVGTDATGSASAPRFTANDIAGSYTVTASSAYGSVSFSLSTPPPGSPRRSRRRPPTSQAAYRRRRLQPAARRCVVLDANGNPVDGATVTFSLGSSGGGAGAGAARRGGRELRRRSGAGDRDDRRRRDRDLAAVHRERRAGRVHRDRRDGRGHRARELQLDNVAGKPPTLTPARSATRSAPVDGRYGEPLAGRGRSTPPAKPLQGVTVTFTLGLGCGRRPPAPAAAVGRGELPRRQHARRPRPPGPRGRATSPLVHAPTRPRGRSPRPSRSPA